MSLENGRILDFGSGTTASAPVEEKQAERELTDEEMEAAMPKPSGFKVLIALPQVEVKYNGSIIEKADQTMRDERTMSVVGLVVELGPDAYADKERFPSGPYCAPGQYVLIAPYQGQRFYVGDKEFRILNDDSVLGVVSDPSSYRRI